MSVTRKRRRLAFDDKIVIRMQLYWGVFGVFVCVCPADLAGTWSYKTVDGTKLTGDRVEETRKTSEILLHFGHLCSIVNEDLCLVGNSKKNMSYCVRLFESGTMAHRCPLSSGWSAASSPTRWTLASASTGWRSRGRKRAGWSICIQWVSSVSCLHFFQKKSRGDKIRGILIFHLPSICRQRSWMRTKGWSVQWTITSYRMTETDLRWAEIKDKSFKVVM